MLPEQCKIVRLPRICDPRGSITFIEGDGKFPHPIKRVYYLYDVPSDAERGGHAHRHLHQLLIAMSGSFDVHLDDGRQRRTIHLNRPYLGLSICPYIWRELDNFSSGSICLVLASEHYDESDYMRDYDDFVEIVKGRL